MNPWTVVHQAPLSMGFSRQEYWSNLPFPSPRDLPNPGIKPTSLALAGGFFTTVPPGKPLKFIWASFKLISKWSYTSFKSPEISKYPHERSLLWELPQLNYFNICWLFDETNSIKTLKLVHTKKKKKLEKIHNVKIYYRWTILKFREVKTECPAVDLKNSYGFKL